MASAFAIQPTALSRAGVDYQAANGAPIKNHGERKVKGYTDDWRAIGLSCQVADVRCPLGSVRQMVQAGNAVVFEKGKCRIINRETGNVIPVRESRSGFELDMWVKAGNRGQIAQTSVSNSFKELEEEEEEGEEEEDNEEEMVSMDFIRQEALL